MKTLAQWLNEYGESHRQPTNILIHKVCVPTIVFTVFGLLWAVPLPAQLRQSLLLDGIGYANLATLAGVLGLLFYIRLSLVMAAGMAAMCVPFLWLLGRMEAAGVNILAVSVAIFVVAWIGQFVGHKLEGKKPSFFKDVQFLLIGPAWTLAALFRAVGIRY